MGENSGRTPIRAKDGTTYLLEHAAEGCDFAAAPGRSRAGIAKPGFMPWHGQRHTALTIDAAVGNPNVYVRATAGHSTITERYVHAAQMAFPGAVERSEERLFGAELGTELRC